MAIGQAGSIAANSLGVNTLIRVVLDEPLTNPVFSLTASNLGGDPFSLRVVDMQTDANGDVVSFDFLIEEWEYRDDIHATVETINWLAIEEGVHTLADGRIIEAGTVTTNAGSGNTAVSLNGGFTSRPVVLTSVMSNNDTTTVDSDPLAISTTGFNIQMQEEESQLDDHAPETVGYIAIQSGGSASTGTANAFENVNHNTDILSLGATFNNAIVVGDTQTVRGPDPARLVLDGGTNSTVGVYLQEEQSGDTETNHINERVGIVAFEEGLIMCFTPDAQILTPDGYRNILALQAGDLATTLDHGLRPLRWIAQSRLSATQLHTNPDLAPIRIEAGALGQGRPHQTLTVSPQHRVLLSGWQAELLFGFDEVLAPAKALLNGHTITQRPADAGADYIHLLFDSHEIIDSNGLWTESLYPAQLDSSHMDHAAQVELQRLFPDLGTLVRDFGPVARRALTVREARLLAA